MLSESGKTTKNGQGASWRVCIALENKIRKGIKVLMQVQVTAAALSNLYRMFKRNLREEFHPFRTVRV